MPSSSSDMSSESPKLLDQVRSAIRARHYSRRTEEAYVHWIKRYILFHGKRHPRELGASHVSAFLTSMAVKDHVAASTQNQALSGVLSCTVRSCGRIPVSLPTSRALGRRITCRWS